MRKSKDKNTHSENRENNSQKTFSNRKPCTDNGKHKGQYHDKSEKKVLNPVITALILCAVIVTAVLSIYFVTMHFNNRYFAYPKSVQINDAVVRYMNGEAFVHKSSVVKALTQVKASYAEPSYSSYETLLDGYITIVDGEQFISFYKLYDATGYTFYIRTEYADVEHDDHTDNIDRHHLYIQDSLGEFTTKEIENYITKCKQQKLNLAEAIYFLNIVRNVSVDSYEYLQYIINLANNIKENKLSNYDALVDSIAELNSISIQLFAESESLNTSSLNSLYNLAVIDFMKEYLLALSESPKIDIEVRALLSKDIIESSLTIEETVQFMWEHKDDKIVDYTQINPPPELQRFIKAAQCIEDTRVVTYDSDYPPVIPELKQYEIALNIFDMDLLDVPLVQTYWDRLSAAEQGILLSMPDRPEIKNAVTYTNSDAKIEFPEVTVIDEVEIIKVTQSDMIDEATVYNGTYTYYLSLTDMNIRYDTNITEETLTVTPYIYNEKTYVSLNVACSLWEKIFFISDDDKLLSQEIMGEYTGEDMERVIETFHGNPLPLALFYIGVDKDLPADDSTEFLDFVTRLATYTSLEGYEDLLNAVLDYIMCGVYSDTYNYSVDGNVTYAAESDRLSKIYFYELYKALMSDKVFKYLPGYAQDMLSCKGLTIDNSRSNEDVIADIKTAIETEDLKTLRSVVTNDSTKLFLQGLVYTKLNMEDLVRYPDSYYPKVRESKEAVLAIVLYYCTYSLVDNFADLWLG